MPAERVLTGTHVRREAEGLAYTTSKGRSRG